ncbi:LysR family transcriptional regulator [Ferrimonas senticii]|uniref:LysR family transcriptional regulator n=1 Tax=Ferrimonas senticii TaxID=394566 RepID=UPI0004195992|nr:LysR family transcriptional regulator [Ferrimonas senticii]
MSLSERMLLLLDVVESGSFVAAAQLQQIDRSVVSKQISKLEAELGVRLLNRTTRALALTAAGQEVLSQAQQLRTLLSDTKRLAQNYHSQPLGKLKIASAIDFGRRFVQPAIIEFQRHYPDIEIELRLDDRLVDMVSENFDLGFRTGKPKDSNLIARKLARNRLLLVASPEFIQRHGEPTSVAELERLPAAVYASAGMQVDRIGYLDPQGQPASLQLNVSYRVNDLDMLLVAAKGGGVLAAITAQSITDEVTQGQLLPLLTDLPLEDFGTIYAVYPHRELPMKSALFLQAMQQRIGTDSPCWEHNIPGFQQMYRQR